MLYSICDNMENLTSSEKYAQKTNCRWRTTWKRCSTTILNCQPFSVGFSSCSDAYWRTHPSMQIPSGHSHQRITSLQEIAVHGWCHNVRRVKLELLPMLPRYTNMPQLPKPHPEPSHHCTSQARIPVNKHTSGVWVAFRNLLNSRFIWQHFSYDTKVSLEVQRFATVSQSPSLTRNSRIFTRAIRSKCWVWISQLKFSTNRRWRFALGKEVEKISCDVYKRGQSINFQHRHHAHFMVRFRLSNLFPKIFFK